jgi:hypothetical protein
LSIENRILRVFRPASSGDRWLGDKGFACQDAIDPARGETGNRVQRRAVQDSAAVGMSVVIPHRTWLPCVVRKSIWKD